MKTKDGTLIVAIDKPDKDLKVQVLDDDGKVIIEQPGDKENLTISVVPGQRRLRLKKGDFQVFAKDDITIKAGGEETIEARLEPPLGAIASNSAFATGKTPADQPPLAIAPLDTAKAKQIQEAWAKQLGVPVEITNSIGMKLVLIPPGEFMMGSPDLDKNAERWEKPQHHVRITKPFYLGVMEVTQEEYQRVMGTNPSYFSATGNGKDKLGGQDTTRFPLENVTWDDAAEFCRKVSQMPEEKTARWYRLPSEAQWEYACRAGSTTRYCFGDEESGLGEYAWYGANSNVTTHPVGGKKPNAWGLYDMHGNVWEWCQDYYFNENYAQSATDDPTGPDWSIFRTFRGGGWSNGTEASRSASRIGDDPGRRSFCMGFRVSLVLAETAAERAKLSVNSDAGQTFGGVAIAAREVKPSTEYSVPSTPSVAAPPLAVAPFDAEKAKQHQEAWAKHLGVPVEMTNSIGMKLVLNPPGEFTMGNGGDVHKVRITKPFYLGKYLVTQTEWDAVMGLGSNPSKFKGPSNPVEQVSWDDCQLFVKRLSERCGVSEGSYRLPTEAQWEYAYRAGTTGVWFFGDNESALDDYAWYEKNSENRTHPVGQKKANPWGLFDICGNAGGWCMDWWDDWQYGRLSPLNDPVGPPSGQSHVIRGGSYLHPASNTVFACRWCYPPQTRLGDVGLRVSLVLAEKQGERVKCPVASQQAKPAIISSPESEIRDMKWPTNWKKVSVETTSLGDVNVMVLKPFRGAPPPGIKTTDNDTEVLIVPVNLWLMDGAKRTSI